VEVVGDDAAGFDPSMPRHPHGLINDSAWNAIVGPRGVSCRFQRSAGGRASGERTSGRCLFTVSLPPGGPRGENLADPRRRTTTCVDRLSPFHRPMQIPRSRWNATVTPANAGAAPSLNQCTGGNPLSSLGRTHEYRTCPRNEPVAPSTACRQWVLGQRGGRTGLSAGPRFLYLRSPALRCDRNRSCSRNRGRSPGSASDAQEVKRDRTPAGWDLSGAGPAKFRPGESERDPSAGIRDDPRFGGGTSTPAHNRVRPRRAPTPGTPPRTKCLAGSGEAVR
jgi:hypothetical protein